MNAITNPAAIKLVQMLAQRGAMKLELLGMKHSSGKSITAVVKKEYGLKGKRESIAAQFDIIIADYREALETGMNLKPECNCPKCNAFAIVALTPAQRLAQPDNTSHVCHPALGGCNHGFTTDTE